MTTEHQNRFDTAQATQRADTGHECAGGDHVFDSATRLVAEAPGAYVGETSPAYANMVGPYGG
ncbi:MAG TPA: hypothetical protein PK177_08770, partial [Burkholderiaceae bacterium]|nr:hypothetical protein [Burkholderiaceae bacterium]